MTNTSVPLQWIGTEGGPLLLLPSVFLPDWEGADAPSGGRVVEARCPFGSVATDYDRACDVEGYIGPIAVGAGTGLVLGDEPLAATWRPEEQGGVLVRLATVDADVDEDDPAFLEPLRSVPHHLWEVAGFRFNVPDGPLCLFDAVLPGRAYGSTIDGPVLWLDVAEGCYAVATAVFRPDAETTLYLHRLVRSS